MSARPIREHVPGAPVQPGERVRIVRAIDTEVYSVHHLIGRCGRVERLDYASGCGQSHPGDPMIGVRFRGGKREMFWKQEIEVLS